MSDDRMTGPIDYPTRRDPVQLAAERLVAWMLGDTFGKDVQRDYILYHASPEHRPLGGGMCVCGERHELVKRTPFEEEARIPIADEADLHIHVSRDLDGGPVAVSLKVTGEGVPRLVLNTGGEGVPLLIQVEGVLPSLGSRGEGCSEESKVEEGGSPKNVAVGHRPVTTDLRGMVGTGRADCLACTSLDGQSYCELSRYCLKAGHD